MPADSSSGIDSSRAWIIVAAAFFGSFIVFGVSYSFGVFLKPIGTNFGVGHATMTAIFSTLSVLSFFLAPITGDLADRFGPRYVVVAGALLMGAGLLLTARVHWFPLLFVTYGLCVGASVACVYIPLVASVGEWFKLRRDIALGIAISGIGCGTLTAAPLAAMLTERFGWRTAFEIFGWTSAIVLLVCATLVSRPAILRAKDTANVIGMMRTRTFVLMYLGLTFSGIAIYIAFVFLPAFATDVGATRLAGGALIGYIGASSVIGRLGLNALAPRFGLLNMYKASYFILLISSYFWLTGHNYAALVIFGLVMGVGYGGIAAMSPAVAASMFGIEGLGELLGFLFTGFGVACLVGPPLAGVLVDYTHDYKWPVFVAAASAAIGLIAVVPLRAGEWQTSPKPEPANNAVGLLSAGSAIDRLGIANPICNVLNKFGVFLADKNDCQDGAPAPVAGPEALAYETNDRYDDFLMSLPHVVGHSTGVSSDGSGEIVIVVYLEKAADDALRAIPSSLDGFAVQVVVSEPFTAFPATKRNPY